MRQEVPENWLLGAPRKNIQKLARSGSKRQKKNKEKKVGDPIVSCETWWLMWSRTARRRRRNDDVAGRQARRVCTTSFVAVGGGGGGGGGGVVRSERPSDKWGPPFRGTGGGAPLPAPPTTATPGTHATPRPGPPSSPDGQLFMLCILKGMCNGGGRFNG